MSLFNKKKQKKKKHPSIKRDYQNKNLSNPFFKKTGKGKKRHLWWLWFLLVPLLIFLVFYFLSAPWLNITNVKVKGLGRLPESAILESVSEQISKPIGRFFDQENILLFKVKEATESLLKEFNFSQIKISKSYFPNELTINIQERPYAFIWIEEGKTYYSDASGFIINDQEVSPDDLLRLPVVENRSKRILIKEGVLDLPIEYLKYIFKFNEEAELYPDLTISKFIIPQQDSKLKSLRVLFSDGLLAYFSIDSNVKDKILSLDVVKKEKIKDNLSNISYVDLRYGDKVFIGNK